MEKYLKNFNKINVNIYFILISEIAEPENIEYLNQNKLSANTTNILFLGSLSKVFDFAAVRALAKELFVAVNKPFACYSLFDSGDNSKFL
jgi:hypothetical protein